METKVAKKKQKQNPFKLNKSGMVYHINRKTDKYRYDLENIKKGDFAFSTAANGPGGWEYGIGYLVTFVDNKKIVTNDGRGLSKKLCEVVYDRTNRYVSINQTPYLLLKAFVRPKTIEL